MATENEPANHIAHPNKVTVLGTGDVKSLLGRFRSRLRLRMRVLFGQLYNLA